VTVEDETLIVQAKRSVEKDGAVSTKEFSRKIRIPPDVDPERLSSTLTSDGILTVEAPVPPQYCGASPSAALGGAASTASSQVHRLMTEAFISRKYGKFTEQCYNVTFLQIYALAFHHSFSSVHSIQ